MRTAVATTAFIGAAVSIPASKFKGITEGPLQRTAEALQPPTEQEKRLVGTDPTGHLENMPPAVLADRVARRLGRGPLDTPTKLRVQKVVHYFRLCSGTGPSERFPCFRCAVLSLETWPMSGSRSDLHRWKSRRPARVVRLIRPQALMSKPRGGKGKSPAQAMTPRAKGDPVVPNLKVHRPVVIGPAADWGGRTWRAAPAVSRGKPEFRWSRGTPSRRMRCTGRRRLVTATATRCRRGRPFVAVVTALPKRGGRCWRPHRRQLVAGLTA